MQEKVGGLRALQAVIQERFDLGEVALPEQVPDAHQRRHRKLVADTDRGKFLVKTYARDPYVLDALRFQHRLSDHLANHGIPVARIQRARNGKRIVEVDDWALELQQFVEGQGMRINAATLGQSAEALGRFHEVCRDFPRPGRDTGMWRFSEVPRSAFAELYQTARKQGDPLLVDEHCNELALFLQHARDELDWGARRSFETGLIHGDWHGGNLIFQGGKLAAIVDLEFAGDGCFLEDLAYGVSNLCIRTSTDPAHLLKRAELVLTRYGRFRTLSFGESVALFYAVGIKHVTTVAYQLTRNRGTLAGIGASGWMERLTKQCRWLDQQAEKVRWGKRA